VRGKPLVLLIFFDALKTNFVQFIKAIFSEVGGSFSIETLYSIAYFAGNVVGFVIEFIIELLVTGGTAAVTKFFTGLASFGKNIISKLSLLFEKILNISLKQIGKDIISQLSLLAKFFSLSKEKLVQFFAELFTELRIIFGIGLKPATEALFEKLGLAWRSIRIPTLNSGVRLGDQLWGVYHKGVVVVKGTKKEIEEFAVKLKGMADDVAKKYLDDLVEDINKYKTPTKFHIEEVARIRKLYKPRPTRNVAFCKSEIDGIKLDLECVSGGEKAPWKQKGNFEPPKPEEYHFKNGPDPKVLLDTEQKMFEYLYKKFSQNKNVFGKIEIVTDLKFCGNCDWIINQFQKEFPNIEIIRVFIKNTLK
jgi:hypothetical protein